ncbi:iron-containing alcohol dehydrogenase [Bradyrhizobium sp. HKCCYLS20291]|uniref:iron-containing alcohol dehydrogenase n=1 Tax=Bradyrhizobium sp. HKCCYLS20291 TaxID=3420766 RepID=UPI003EBA7181
MTESSLQNLMPGTQRNYLQERVVHGQPAAEVIVEETRKLGKSRVFITTSPSLSREDGLPRQVAQALGERFAGLYSGITAHSPRQCVIDGAAAAREANADIMVAIGGGSVIDATKVMLICLWHGLKDPSELDPYIGGLDADPSRWPADGASRVRMIAVPTMFSAAEFTWFAGVFNPNRHAKDAFAHPLIVPQVVVLDPAATLPTPLPILYATGMKAIDHAVERLCGLHVPPLAEAVSKEALRLLYTSLPQMGGPADNLGCRMSGQFGMWLSISGGTGGVPVGASHALGHVIGGYGVPHGETTGVCLPSVLRWNLSANSARQDATGEVIGVKGLALADAIETFVSKLGLPTRMRDVGIKREQFSEIATRTLHDWSSKTNPRPLTTESQVIEILDLAW